MVAVVFQRLYAQFFKHAPHSEAATLIGSGLLVGLLAGVGVWLFKQLIDLAHWLFFETTGSRLAGANIGLVFIIPVLGGRLRYNRIPAKAAASALSIGSGASVGPEDPSVQIGSKASCSQWIN